MRTSLAFLLTLAAITPATSKATTVLNGTWAYDINGYTTSAAARFTVDSGDWSINSLTLDGLTVNTGSYTPVATDFSVRLIDNNGSTIGATSGTSAGSLVPQGNGYRSHFAVTFNNISNWNITSGSYYNLWIGTNFTPSGDLSSLRLYGPFGGTGTNGFSYQGPLAVTLNATQTGGGSPVPEPSTYGLALSGLALATVMIRRRAKRSA